LTDTLDESALPVVRAARSGDASLLARWACAMAWETEQKRLDPEVVARGVNAVFEQPGRAGYFIAEHSQDGTLVAVGTLMLTHEWSDWRCGDWWWIQSVYVDPAHRRRGVYRALHEHVRRLAMASSQVCGLRLYVEKANANAQRTYASLGMNDAGYAMFEEDFVRH
jgi:GNAT superfamily N-acetyltransferase